MKNHCKRNFYSASLSVVLTRYPPDPKIIPGRAIGFSPPVKYESRYITFNTGRLKITKVKRIC
jgi:hypothetical protein